MSTDTPTEPDESGDAIPGSMIVSRRDPGGPQTVTFTLTDDVLREHNSELGFAHLRAASAAFGFGGGGLRNMGPGMQPPPMTDADPVEPLGSCVVHGDYWTDDCDCDTMTAPDSPAGRKALVVAAFLAPLTEQEATADAVVDALEPLTTFDGGAVVTLDLGEAKNRTVSRGLQSLGMADTAAAVDHEMLRALRIDRERSPDV